MPENFSKEVIRLDLVKFSKNPISGCKGNFQKLLRLLIFTNRSFTIIFQPSFDLFDFAISGVKQSWGILAHVTDCIFCTWSRGGHWGSTLNLSAFNMPALIGISFLVRPSSYWQQLYVEGLKKQAGYNYSGVKIIENDKTIYSRGPL